MKMTQKLPNMESNAASDDELIAANFGSCSICNANDWKLKRVGADPFLKIRDGVFGKYKSNALIAECTSCGVERLHEDSCVSDDFYETDAYRKHLEQGLTAGDHFQEHDWQQPFVFEDVPIHTLRNKTVAEIGCAGGSFLDHIAGVTPNIVAVEPCDIYRESLTKRAYHYFPYADDATSQFTGKVDNAFCFQVIEHVVDPLAFLKSIAPLLQDDGQLVLSTPNRNDILMHLMPEEFCSFFYRVVHRWYFDEESISRCFDLAGFDVVSINYKQRYGMANALNWLKEKRPTGHNRIDAISQKMDVMWQSYVTESKMGEYMLVTAKKKKS